MVGSLLSRAFGFSASSSTHSAVRHSVAGVMARSCGAGETCAIRELAGPAPLGGAADFALQDELHTQLYLPAPRYVLVRPPSAWS